MCSRTLTIRPDQNLRRLPTSPLPDEHTGYNVTIRCYILVDDVIVVIRLEKGEEGRPPLAKTLHVRPRVIVMPKASVLWGTVDVVHYYCNHQTWLFVRKTCYAWG